MRVRAKGPRRDKQNAKSPARARKSISKESDSQPKQDQQFEGERRVVLFDLDGTLMKSSEAWEDCSKRALAQLTQLSELSVTHETAFNAYRAIYDCHASIKGRIGPRGHIFEDVRQEWNTRTSYALLLAWSDLFFGFLRTPQDLDLKVLKDAQNSAALFKRAEEIRDKWSIEYAPQIDRAIEEFRKGKFSQYLYPGVPDLLLKLREKGIQYNIATEGDLPTQWWKIRALGLDKPHRAKPEDPPLIKASQLLTTSQAARPHRALQALLSLSERYRGRAAASLEASKVKPPLGDHHRSQLEIASKAATLGADGLARMAGFFTRLASKISEDASGEVQPEFYTRVLYAINQAPDDPRHQLDVLQELSKWEPTARIRLAMVGDKHRSDVLPVRRLVIELRKKIMSIWVKQGKHGKSAPDPGQSKEWVECKTIAEAVQGFLLDDNAWRERTDCIEEPARLFFSVIQAARGSDETLPRNIHQLLAGIGAVRNTQDQLQHDGAHESMLETEITRTVTDLIKFIVIDIRSTPDIRPKVVQVLTDLCPFDDVPEGTGVLEHCPGLPKATIELLLAIVGEKDDPTEESEQCLDKMAGLLDVQRAEWAAAVIEVLMDAKNMGVVEHICSSRTMSRKYYDQLVALRRGQDNLPPNFPLLRMGELFFTMQGCNRKHEKRVSETAPPRSGGKETALGESAKHTKRQQRIYLGTNPDGNPVYCFLGGPKIRNIVCVCGSPGSGKSSSLTALVLGALNGEGVEPGSTPKSAVIVFHHELGGPCEFVGPARDSGLVTKVFAFEDELANVRTEYPKLQPNQVIPIRFRLDQLSNEQITRWLGFPEKSALAKGFREARTTLRDKKSVKELREAIETTFLDPKQRKQVLNALKKLEPIVAKAGESTVDDEVNPGQLIVIDCGRGGGLAARLPAWEIVVSVLEKHWDSDRKDEQTLLVFDELHQSLSQNTDSDAKQLSSRLRGLGDRLGRHQQVSIVAASQTAKDFKEGGDLWEAATVLLFHFLRAEVVDVPKGNLWQRAKQHLGFGDLGKGQAWYCAAGQDPDTVQVRRRP